MHTKKESQQTINVATITFYCNVDLVRRATNLCISFFHLKLSLIACLTIFAMSAITKTKPEQHKIQIKVFSNNVQNKEPTSFSLFLSIHHFFRSPSVFLFLAIFFSNEKKSIECTSQLLRILLHFSIGFFFSQIV